MPGGKIEEGRITFGDGYVAFKIKPRINTPLPPQVSRILEKPVIHKGTGKVTFGAGYVSFDIDLRDDGPLPPQVLRLLETK